MFRSFLKCNGIEKKKRRVRSGIRTHAYRSRLRPERSALDRSAILTLLISVFESWLILFVCLFVHFKVGISTDKMVYLKRSYAKGKKKKRRRLIYCLDGSVSKTKLQKIFLCWSQFIRKEWFVEGSAFKSCVKFSCQKGRMWFSPSATTTFPRCISFFHSFMSSKDHADLSTSKKNVLYQKIIISNNAPFPLFL